MSTTQKTSSQFAPSGMATYNAVQPNLAQTLSYYLGGQSGGVGSNAGPFGSSLFKSAYGQGTINAQQQGQTAMGNIGQNAAQFGGGNVPGFLQSQAKQAGYQTSGAQQNSYWNALNSTVNSQLGAASTAAGFKPLQTGQTQTTSGLGTWLPQLLGAGISAGLAPFTGGMSLGGLAGSLGQQPTLGGSSSGFSNAMMAGVNPSANPAPSFGLPSGASIPGLGASMTGAVPGFNQSNFGGSF